MVPVLWMACSTASAVAPKAPTIAGLGWMSGRWVEEKGERWTEENWSAPRAGTMLGTSLSGRGTRLGDWEFLRLVADADGLTYWASPAGRPPVPFRLVSASGTEAVFENPKHDYPTRIAYSRTGDVLTATISGPGGAPPITWRYTRR
jgi:hypothetical protein